MFFGSIKKKEINTTNGPSDIYDLHQVMTIKVMPCKVPYLEGGFEVHGLPEGILFEKPYNYGHI